MEKLSFCETRTIVIDDREMDLIRFYDGKWKIHNWDKAAIRPTCGKGKKEYYLYGIQFSKDDFLEAVKDRKGVPFHKNPALKDIVRL